MKRRGFALVGASAALLSCSLLVGGEPFPLHCSEEGRRGPPACDPGWSCRAGVCEPGPAAGMGMGMGPGPGAGSGGSAGEPGDGEREQVELDAGGAGGGE